MTKCHYDVEFLYKPQKGWVYNKKGEEIYIKKDIADTGKRKDLKQVHPLITNSNFFIIGKKMKL